MRRLTDPGLAANLGHRSEHWIVVEGAARVTVNDGIRLIGENESV